MTDQTAVSTNASAPADGLAVATLHDLLSKDGVPLPPGDDPVLAVVGDQPRCRFVTAPLPAGAHPTAQLPQFEGGEHTFIGNGATLHFEGGDRLASDGKLKLPNGLALTYGQIVALAGDFYGLPGKPISDDPAPPARFYGAFATLAIDRAAVTEAPQILDVMGIEIGAVNEAVARGSLPSSVYKTLGDTLSGKWNRITGGGSKATDFYPKGRYLVLASTNWDHFGSSAMTSYRIGHQAAMTDAIAAAHMDDPATREALLQRAYAENAFADHYLTDLFSAGHLRTPRRELYDTVSPPDVGSLLARFMHDEDCHYGLTVTSVRGDTWRAYGDKRLRDPVSAPNLDRVRRALQASIDEVWAAYRNGVAPDSAVLGQSPSLTALGDPTDRRNPSPLFVARRGSVARRTDIANRADYSWTTSWWGSSTLAALKLLPEATDLGDDEIPIQLGTDLLEFWESGNTLVLTRYGVLPDATWGQKWTSGDTRQLSADTLAWVPVDRHGDGDTSVLQCRQSSGKLAMTLYSPTHAADSSYAVAWYQDDIGTAPSAVAWIPLDADGDGITDLVQCYEAGNQAQSQLGMVVYGPSPNGPGYAIRSRSSFAKQPADAVAWLPVDFDGDGTMDVLQCRSNGGKLAMTLYSPHADGYLEAWTNNDMGTGSVAVKWMAVDVDGDGRTEVVQCWNNGGVLGMVVYAPYRAGYELVWENPTMAPGPGADRPPGPGALAWIAADVDGDHRTEIVQLWKNGDKLGMVGYAPLDGAPGYASDWQNPDVGAPSDALAWLAFGAGDEGTNAIGQLRADGGSLTMNVFRHQPDRSWDLTGSMSRFGPAQGTRRYFVVGSGTTVVSE